MDAEFGLQDPRHRGPDPAKDTGHDDRQRQMDQPRQIEQDADDDGAQASHDDLALRPDIEQSRPEGKTDRQTR